MEVDVLECNILYVELFTFCQPELTATFGGFLWRNIAPGEIYAVCQLRQVEPRIWPDVLENLMFMGSVVSGYLNKKGTAK